MRNKFILTLSIAALVSVFGMSGLHAQSNDRNNIERPGYDPDPVTKTLIFNVASGSSHDPLYRASVECDYARLSKRKRTDSTGTAPLSFSFQPGRIRPPAKATCVVMKSGYRPSFKSFDISRINSPLMVEILLSPDRVP